MEEIYMNKKTAITVLVIIIVAALFLGFLLVNKRDGPVAGIILADKAMEDTNIYNAAAKTHGDGIYLVVSNAFNKFQEDYKANIVKAKNLYATIHFVECPKGSEYTGKWLKEGKVIQNDMGTLPTGPEGVISYMLDKGNVVKGSYSFELYDGDRKIFEKVFSVE
jgi:hypothetical protein